MRKRHEILVIAVAIFVLGSAAAGRAQDLPADPLDRVIPAPHSIAFGRGAFGLSLFQVFELLSVPFGVEEAGALVETSMPRTRWEERGREIKIGGLTVRAALDKIVAADPRYEWRLLDGVVLLRPIEAWKDPRHPLLRPVPPAELDRVVAWEAVDAVREASGHASSSDEIFSGERVFSVTFGGGPLIDLLNAIVAAHGEMGWVLEREGSVSGNAKTVAVHPTLSVWASLGQRAELKNVLLEPETLVPASVRFSGTSAAQAPRGLDVPLAAFTNVFHARDLVHVAESVGVPFGFEEADALVERVSKPFRRARGEVLVREGAVSPLVQASGRTFREVLDAVAAVDPRYEGRDMDGVIVMRPVSAWAGAEHPLAAAVSPVVLRNARVSQGFDALSAAVSHTSSTTGTYGDESRFSIDFRGGTLLQLANAIVRGHGRLSWSVLSHVDYVQIDDSTAVETVEPFLGLAGRSFPLVQAEPLPR